MHERKYMINDEEKIVKRDTGIPIPEDEPLFILRAKDVNALPVLLAYMVLCQNLEHRKGLGETVKDFKKFISENPEKMGEPD